jgi:UDP-glucose 4-epimerase
MERDRIMKILVTGGTGFIGTNLIKQLLADGHHVTSIDNYSTGRKENEIDHVNVIYHNANIKNTYYYYESDYDIVFHLAAIARIQPSFERPQEYIETNFNGTYKLVQYCVEKGIPLIYAGSSSHHSGKFKNPYTFSKDLGEDVIKLYQEHFNLKTSVARFYNVYGPHQLTEGGYTTLIGRWLHNIENGIPCEIYGDGTKRRDFTHVDDIIEALVKIMNRKKYGYIFELGKGENHSVLDVARMFDIDPIFKPEKPGEADMTLANKYEARVHLGWEPKINLKDYIKGEIV